jgi:hypothetical protein
VGRRRELASFDDALEGRSSRRVLLVHGPGGIGKTTLLLELRTRGRDVGRAVVLLDAGRSTRRPRGSSTPSWPPSANRPAGPWPAAWPGPSCWSTATSSSARSTAGCARRSCPPCPPTPWSSWPAATPRHRPGAPTRAGAHWSPSVVSTTSTRPRATSCSPSPGSPRRSAPTWCGSVAATRWPWPCSRCRGHRHGPRQPRRGPRSCLGPAGDAAAGRAQRRPHVRAGRLRHRLADHRGPAPQGGGRRRARGVGPGWNGGRSSPAGPTGSGPTTWPGTCWTPSSSAARRSGTGRCTGSSTTTWSPACAPPPASTASSWASTCSTCTVGAP